MVAGVAYRVRAGNFIGVHVMPQVTGITIGGEATIEYDDGRFDVIQIDEATTSAGAEILMTGRHIIRRDGYVVGLALYKAGAIPRNSIFITAFVTPDAAFTRRRQILCKGYMGNFRIPSLGIFEDYIDGAYYVFQGTILEDATAGTHVTSVTFVTATDTELEVVAGSIIVGNTATAQTARAFVDDGTNKIYDLLNAGAVSGTTASLAYSFPSVATTAAVGATSEEQPTGFAAKISGTMRLVLQVTTTAVSVTQTFSVICLHRGAAGPVPTLADTVGTPTLTTNTNKFF